MSEFSLYGDGIHDDTAGIQRLLDNADGLVEIADGTYLVSATLKIHPHTHLKLSPNAIFKLADRANCTILENDAIVNGKYVLGQVDEGITVEGGVWDGNNENQIRDDMKHGKKITEYQPDFYMGILMRFVGVKQFRLCNMVMKDPESYGVQICNAEHFVVENIHFDYNLLRLNMDGIHIQGTTKYGAVRNIFGKTNDDMVALNCDDCNYCEIAHGNIENISIDGLYCENGYTGVRLLSCGSVMNNISIRNIFGTFRYNCISFTHHSVHPGKQCSINNVFISDIFAAKAEPMDNDPYGMVCLDHALIQFFPGTHTHNVSISDLHRDEQTDVSAPTVWVCETATVDRMILNNISQSNTTAELFLNSGIVTGLVKRDFGEDLTEN